MKKFLIVLAIFALCCTACSTDDGDDGDGKGGKGDTTLTITNSSDYNNLLFSFGTTDFKVMNRGQSSTETVSAGTRVINVIAEYTFQNPAIIETGIASLHQMFEVNEVFTCEEGKSNQYTFTNATVVTMIGGDTGYRDAGGLTKGTLKDIFAGIENYYLHMDD